jgi:asparagine synthase (glutamine-hydrolysing)
VSLSGSRIPDLDRRLAVMQQLLAHRGPDGRGTFVNRGHNAGLGHVRLSIIDLSDAANQPMAAENGTVIAYNGEIYNYLELHAESAGRWAFRTRSDTEAILAAYARHGTDCVTHLRGMFAFALWDPREQQLFCARDRFGIKPFYYARVGDEFMFASEIKALVPFLPDIETHPGALAEYLTFQFTLGEQTPFRGVYQLMPGHSLRIRNGNVEISRYWDVHYDIDHDHNAAYFERRLRELMDDSIRVHLRSDVPLGSYLSGGVDSSLIAILASRFDRANDKAFHGKFIDHPGYDESRYAAAAADAAGKELHQIVISSRDFVDRLRDVIWHLDFPVAGPGAFPQFMVAGLAARHLKVVLGGQGGDEIFGGYARYLLAYFEQCIKAAIDGTYASGNFVVTAESIIPNLGVLQEYLPLVRKFWREGLFESLDRRYFRLIDRSADVVDEVRWEELDKSGVYEAFSAIFNSTRNVRHEAYFDSMTHFDFKTLLPALLHVEDRMSMAHGLESRVPLLDHPLVEFAATVPADVKFRDGHMKHLIKRAFADCLPAAIRERRDKMGFPVPLNEWFEGELREFVQDVFRSRAAASRPFIDAAAVCAHLDRTERFSRKMWGLLSLELWHQNFHDRAAELRRMAGEDARAQRPVSRTLATGVDS